MSCTFWNMQRKKEKRAKEERKANANAEVKEVKHKRGIIQQDDLERIFELINENRQFYDKNRSNRDNQLQDITNLGYNLSAYNNLLI